MKKVLVAALAVALAAVMAVPAYSSDFSISGEFKVQAWNTMDTDYNSDADDDSAYFKQRVRVAPNFKVNDELSVHLRMDIAEGVWGDDYSTWNRGWAGYNNNLGVDRAYMVLNQGSYSLTIGQHYNGVGPNYILWDQQSTGVTGLYKLDSMEITAHYSKMDENGNTVDDVADDVDFYAANLAYTLSDMSANLTFAMRNDASDADISPWAVGLQASKALGALNLNAEFDYFGGSEGNLDVVGTQLFVDASMAMDSMKAGSKFMYALGTDESDEVQYSTINNGAWTFDPMGFDGAINWEFYPLGTSDFFSLDDNSGIMAVNPYVQYTVNDVLTVYANVGYAMPQDDDVTNIDSAMSLAASADYVWLENITLSGGFGYAQPDFEDNSPDDPNMVMLGQLKLDF